VVTESDSSGGTIVRFIETYNVLKVSGHFI